jgi:type I restriction enzyme, S subunit
MAASSRYSREGGNPVSLITDNLDIWSSSIKAKSAVGRGRGKGNGKKFELYGIKKLRELILELAVRGMLVAQDADDEPASELLKKIATEKTRLVKEGKIKKQKALPPIGDDEKPFVLPEGWDWVRLNEIGHDWGQKIPDKTFTYIDVGAINKELGFVSEPSILTANEAPSRARKIVKKGSVIYSTVRPYLLNIAVINEAFKPEPIASTAFAIIHPFDGILASFIYRYLRSPVFINYVESCQTGIAYPAVNDKRLFSGLFPVAPIAEQHRIVTKVDELMALCDQLELQTETSISAHKTLVQTLLGALINVSERDGFNEAWARIAEYFDTLFTTEWSIDQLKQTILQLAVMGKLVPQNPNDEPASELLKKITAEKAKLVKEGEIKKQKPLPPIKEDEKPFSLPVGWAWVPWGEILAFDEAPFKRGPFGSALKKDMFVESGYKVYEQYCPINDDCSFERYYITDEKYDELKGFAVRARDYLVSCSGVTLGRITQVPVDYKEGIINQALLRVRVNHNIIDDEFFKLLFRSPFFQKEIFANSTGSAIPNVKGVKELKVMPVPLLPLGEQIRVVEKFNELMTLCNTLKTQINAAQTTQLQLAEAMAEQAVG